MAGDSWAGVTSVCDPSVGCGEREKENIDGVKLFEGEYFSGLVFARGWQIVSGEAGDILN